MKKTDVKRQRIVDQIADHLLAQGMQASGLRALAAAAGTSDRMLLHYFANKEELMTAALDCVAARMLALLANAGAGQVPFGTLLSQLAGMKNDPAVRPYLRLWLELAALSAAGEESYRSIARQIGDGFYQWLAAALQVEREEERAPMAALAFAVIEGFVFLDAIDESWIIAGALEGIGLLTTQAPRRNWLNRPF
jgi:AcrR family transcriptional regulator